MMLFIVFVGCYILKLVDGKYNPFAAINKVSLLIKHDLLFVIIIISKGVIDYIIRFVLIT